MATSPLYERDNTAGDPSWVMKSPFLKPLHPIELIIILNRSIHKAILAFNLYCEIRKMPQTTFVHTPLDINAEHIRLIRSKSRRCANLKFSLQPYTPANCPTYKAVSYTWEPRYPTRTILLNGKSMEIGDNLWQFLKMVENDYESYYWIDQICIDQANAEERNHQVRQMDEIFHGASQVVIWLGVGSESSDRAMDFIQATRKARISSHTWDAQMHWTEGFDTDDPPAIGLRGLFSRRYWSRLWVVQEIMVARHPMVLCGKKDATWEALEAFQDWTRINRKTTFNHFYTTRYMLPKHANLIIENKRQWGCGHNWTSAYRSLHHITSTYADFECQLLVDKVFGVLGLVAETDRIDADYEEEEWHVICRVLVAMFAKESIQVFTLVETGHFWCNQLHCVGIFDHLLGWVVDLIGKILSYEPGPEVVEPWPLASANDISVLPNLDRPHKMLRLKYDNLEMLTQRYWGYLDLPMWHDQMKKKGDMISDEQPDMQRPRRGKFRKRRQRS